MTHAGSVAQVEEQLREKGVEVVWVLEQDSSSNPGTGRQCRVFMNGRGSDQGLCVGDGETQPMAGVFDSSPFSVRRGFDMLVRRADMRILYTTSHGTPAGNDNLSGDRLVAEIDPLLCH